MSRRDASRVRPHPERSSVSGDNVSGCKYSGLRAAIPQPRDDRFNEFSYLATASLYTNPAVARLTTSKHKSEPSMLKREIETLKQGMMYAARLPERDFRF